MTDERALGGIRRDGDLAMHGHVVRLPVSNVGGKIGGGATGRRRRASCDLVRGVALHLFQSCLGLGRALTCEALRAGFDVLPPASRSAILARHVELCVFVDKEFALYEAAVDDARSFRD